MAMVPQCSQPTCQQRVRHWFVSKKSTQWLLGEVSGISSRYKYQGEQPVVTHLLSSPMCEFRLQEFAKQWKFSWLSEESPRVWIHFHLVAKGRQQWVHTQNFEVQKLQKAPSVGLQGFGGKNHMWWSFSSFLLLPVYPDKHCSWQAIQMPNFMFCCLAILEQLTWKNFVTMVKMFNIFSIVLICILFNTYYVSYTRISEASQ